MAGAAPAPGASAGAADGPPPAPGAADGAPPSEAADDVAEAAPPPSAAGAAPPCDAADGAPVSGPGDLALAFLPADPAPPPGAEDGAPPPSGAVGAAPPPDAAGGAAPSSTRIWLLARGRRGDVQPLVALALGLRAAGHEVKVFGIGLFRGLFAAYGLDYEVADAELAWQSPKGSKWLKVRAWSLGLESPEELLLELDLRKYEVLNWQALCGWRRHLAPTVVATMVEQDLLRLEEPRLNAHLDPEAFSERESSRYREVLAAQCADGEIEPFEFLRQQRRRALARGLCAFAAASGAGGSAVAACASTSEPGGAGGPADDGAGDPRDAAGARAASGARVALAMLQGLARREPAAPSGGHGQAANGRAANGCDPTEQVLEELLSWTQGRDVGEYLQAWRRRLPAWDLWDGPSLDSLQAAVSPVVHRNILGRAERLQDDQRPALVLYTPLMAGVAYTLQRRHGLQIQAAWPRTPVLDSVPHFMIYSDLLAEERLAEASQDASPAGGILAPLEDMGPVAFSDALRSPAQLLGASPALLEPLKTVPAELRRDAEWIRRLKSRMTGHWHLTEEQQTLAGDPYFFGSPEDSEAARRFVAEAERPPVFLSWGNGRHPRGPKALVTLAVKALRIARRRGILASSWPLLDENAFREALSELEEPALLAFAERNVLLLRAVPHAWVLPRCACVVTHGGSGSLDAALRAGVPVIVSPLRQELLARAQEITTLGCGLGLTDVLGELTPWKLATAMKVVLGDDVMQACARELASTLATEPGVRGAVDLVTRSLSGSEGGLVSFGAPERPPIWAEGIYDMFSSEGEFVGRAEIVGGRGWLLANSMPSMWLRAGSFAMQTRDGAQVRCNVEAFFPDGVRHASVSEDGETWSWLSGERYQLKRGFPKHCECTVA